VFEQDGELVGRAVVERYPAHQAPEAFAIVTRPGAGLSPGVRELLTDLEAHMLAVADAFDRSR
jgi:hypothetical protein